MLTIITMPQLGLLMKKGLVAKWFKNEGDRVEKGEFLFEVETEKITKKIESMASGILRKILVPKGYVVPVGEPIGVLAEPGEEIPGLDEMIKRAEKVVTKPTVPVVEKVEKPAVAIPEVKKPLVRVSISPRAKRLAEERGIDITQLTGTGPGGRIIEEDVLRAIEIMERAKALAPAIKEVIPMTGMRKTIAERLSQSYTTAVHVTITTEVDMTETIAFRESYLPEVEKAANVRLSYTHILIKAVAEALKRHPIMNSMIEGDQIKIFDDVNMGVAVALEEGLIVPVIRRADEKSLIEIASETEKLVEKARKGELTPDDVTGGTFTITNLGMLGVDTFTPIINPPESAILGIGRIVRKPVIGEGGETVIRPMMSLSLSFDHRVIDGAVAAKFLQTLTSILQNDPYSLAWVRRVTLTSDGSYVMKLQARKFTWMTDELERFGGTNKYPTPVEAFIGSILACFTSTIVYVAKTHYGIKIKNITADAQANPEKHITDLVMNISVKASSPEPISESIVKEILEISKEACRALRALSKEINLKINLTID